MTYNPDKNPYLADMSLPPDERGRKGTRKRQTTPRERSVTPPAQMSHGGSPRKKKNAEGQARRGRGKKRSGRSVTLSTSRTVGISAKKNF
jgi:hypothetical protein